MILDTLDNCERYLILHKNFETAFQYLRTADLAGTAPGRYELKGDEIIAIISEYATKSEQGEQMESHLKYIDIQYVISGRERMGIALKKDQEVSVPYTEEKECMLYADAPEFFITISQGSFVVFHPNDLHMPTLMINVPEKVKKVVVKVRIA